MSDADVLVVGAGPTGLTMAVELARRGVAVRIIDRSATVNTETRALGVQARSLELFARSGVADEMLRRGLRAERFNVFSEGRQIVRADFSGLPTAYPFLLMLAQPEVEGVLGEELSRYGVEVEREITLTDLNQDASGVRVTLEGQDGRTEVSEHAWVVGADGAHSAVRKLLDVGFVGAAFDENFAVADLRMDWDRPPTEFFAFLDSGRFAAFFPMVGGWHRVALAQPSSEPHRSAREIVRDDLQAAIDRTVPDSPQIGELRQAGRFRINQRRAEAHRVGRVFLAGDAAHIHSVVGAQGMNTGIQDAFNLGWKLASVIQRRVDVELLDSYQAERARVAARLVRGTRRFTRMTLIRNPIATAARRAIAPRVLARAHTQSLLTRAISQIDVSYHNRRGASPARRALVGDRAPDLQLAPGAPRVHDLLSSTGFTGLNFGADETMLSEAVAADVELVTVPPGEQVRAAYGVDEGGLVLVRPDGYIAARGNARDIEAYFDARRPSAVEADADT